MAPKKSKGMGRPDLATMLGLLIAIGSIVGSLLLEGGSLKDISQVTAAIIVLGGTCGAVMVSTPLHVLMGAMRAMGKVLFQSTDSPAEAAEEIIGYAVKARKNGTVSLETYPAPVG